MTNLEKAKIILQQLDETINIDWNFEDLYINAILKALNKIDNESN